MKKLKLLNNLLGIVVIIVAGLVSSQEQFCIPVEPCTEPIIENQIGGLVYEIPAETDFNFICPRTDDKVVHWIIRAVVSLSDSTSVDGTYCGVNITFNSSLVCSTGIGRLAFPHPNQFQDMNGLFEFNFNSSPYNISIRVKYAKTGVFPRQKVIRIVGNEPIILEYFIYSLTSVSDYVLSHDGTVLYQNSMPMSNDVMVVVDTLVCLKAESNERTDVYQFRIMNPMPGSYTLQYDVYTAVINVVGSSPMSSSPVFIFSFPSIANFTNLSVPMDSSSFTPTPTTTGSMPKSISTSPSDPSPTPSLPLPPSPDSQIAAIIGGSVGGVALLIVFSIVLVLVILCCLGCIKNKEYIIQHEDPHAPYLNSVHRNPSMKEESKEVHVETEFVDYRNGSIPPHNHVGKGDVAHEEAQTHPVNCHPEPLHENEKLYKQMPLGNTQHTSSTPSNMETSNGGITHKGLVDDDKTGKYKMVTVTDTQTTQSHPLSVVAGARENQECLPTDTAIPTPFQVVHRQPLDDEYLSIEKKRLEIDQQTLEESKMQTRLLAELSFHAKTGNIARNEHHKEDMELKKEHLEVGRDILETMETARVNETDSHVPIHENITYTTESLTTESSHQPRPSHTTDEPTPSHYPHPLHTTSNDEPCNNLDDSSSPIESNEPLSDADRDSNAL